MLEKSQQKINLDLSYPTIQNVRCVQNDINSRKIVIIISDNSKFYKIKDTYSVLFRQLKPDGNFVEYDNIFTITDGILNLILPDQSCTCPGMSKCQIVIVEGLDLVHTLSFNLIVEGSVLNNNIVESKTESAILDKIALHLVDYSNPHKIPDASANTKGLVKLADSIESDSVTTAATANSVKIVNDKIEDVITHEQIDKLFLD